jgi:hypothetical protein
MRTPPPFRCLDLGAFGNDPAVVAAAFAEQLGIGGGSAAALDPVVLAISLGTTPSGARRASSLVPSAREAASGADHQSSSRS